MDLFLPRARPSASNFKAFVGNFVEIFVEYGPILDKVCDKGQMRCFEPYLGLGANQTTNDNMLALNREFRIQNSGVRRTTGEVRSCG